MKASFIAERLAAKFRGRQAQRAQVAAPKNLLPAVRFLSAAGTVLLAALAVGGCKGKVEEKAHDLGRACQSGDKDKVLNAANALLSEMPDCDMRLGGEPAANGTPTVALECKPDDIAEAELVSYVFTKDGLLQKVLVKLTDAQKDDLCAPPPPNPTFTACSISPASAIVKRATSVEIIGDARDLPLGNNNVPPGQSEYTVVFLVGSNATEVPMTLENLTSTYQADSVPAYTQLIFKGKITLPENLIPEGQNKAEVQVTVVIKLNGQEIGREVVTITARKGGGTTTPGPIVIGDGPI
jgi:hypothetical protein